MPSSSHRLKGNHGSESKLLQFWTTIRLRIFVAAAAKQCGQSLSAFVREACWLRAQAVLDEKTQERLDRQATREETKHLRRQ